MMGAKEVMMEVSTAVVIVMAFRKHIWVRYRPNMEAMNIFAKSPFPTFSLGRNREQSQKSRAAPIALKQKRPRGDINFRLAMSLHTIMFSPNIKYAEKHAMCPKNPVLFNIFALHLYYFHKSDICNNLLMSFIFCIAKLGIILGIHPFRKDKNKLQFFSRHKNGLFGYISYTIINISN